MKNGQRLSALEAAKKFIEEYFPTCDAALLAGSVVRGEATATSDLDIVIFNESLPNCYRESMVVFDWPIEVFVHNLTTYKQYIESDKKRARPSLPRMVTEGIVMKDNGRLIEIKKEAKALLAKGPDKWSAQTIQMKLYFITDTLDDFLGATDRAEEIFIANALAEHIHEFVLRTNNQWVGSSKWVIRALKQYDEAFTASFIDAFDSFYKTGEKSKVEILVDAVLAPYGGRLFAGFSIGKN
ncbi:nucleotidyltransferase [Lottiidibacillus patelloidae]|uniref:Nucleotidyltransferase n=1 Tax=Lottiidibacillus patelloidae TaxID=2670334 RepID=A0A263BTE7_9BACI|nr:nucleotidyltransferase domain-containing protein [Lottiidibacillus patelloidae]OZM56842.1 nucleotidyltransferase [Lottiidibacillus patelloidae]